MRHIAFIGFVFFICANAALAQTPAASVVGRITDPSSAVVVGATVRIANEGTNAVRQTTTNSLGEYVVTNLQPASYRIEVEKAGFRTLAKPGVVVHVGDVVTVDLALTLGQLADAVTVAGGAPLLNTTSASVNTVVDRTFVANLPLNGRSFQSLIWMIPGVVPTPATSTSPGQFSVNGQRSDANYFMLDGVSANIGVQPTAGLGPSGVGAAPGLSAQGGTNSLVSVDAMQEFRMETSTYAAEFGRSPGGQVSIVTRSGTNERHGSLFEYLRNDTLDSADYFVSRQGLSKPKEHQSDFGGVFGTPLRRDRLFAFISYEGLRLDQPRSAVSDVPSIASRSGAPDPVKALLAAFPLPNGPETGQGLAQFSSSYADPSTLGAASIRIDLSLRSLHLFGRYNYSSSDAASRLGSFAIASVNTIGWVTNQLQTATGGATWIITPHISNDLRANWSRNIGTNFQTLDRFGGATVPPAATLHPAYLPPDSDYRVNLGAANVFLDEGSNAANVQRQINLVDTLLIQRAHHQVKLGIDYRRLLPVYDPVDYVQSYTFAGVAGVLSGTATSLLTATSATVNRDSHAANLATYAQDTWTVFAPLTVMYGVRWEIDPPPALSGSTSALSLTSADPASIAIAAPGTPMYRTTHDNFAPRVGAAYRLGRASGNDMVVRSGWGVFFDLPSAASINNLSQTFPFTARRSFANVPYPTDPTLLAPPTIAPGAPVDFLTAADPQLKLPYSYEWNVGVEQAVGAANGVSVTYVGAAGRRLLMQERILNPTPQLQQLTVAVNRGLSRYDALQLKLDRSLKHGLQALVSYTLGQSRDNVSNDSIPELPFVHANPDQDWGASDFDVRHTLSAGVTYILPTLIGHSPWRTVAHGWSIDGVFVARSALPVNVVTGTTAFSVSSTLRPDLVPGAPLYVDDDTVPGGRRFNRAAFAPPPVDAAGNPRRQGTLPRNALRGFPMNQFDLALQRDISLGRETRLQLRAEIFNLLNEASFGPPTNTLNSGLFGQATRTLASSLGGGSVAGGGFSPLYQVGGPRSVQIAAKIQF